MKHVCHNTDLNLNSNSKTDLFQFDIGQVLVEDEEECRAEHSGLQQILPISDQVLATPGGIWPPTKFFVGPIGKKNTLPIIFR